MATIRPFRAYRPLAEQVAQMASRPYDVLNTEEARQVAAQAPQSFIRVVKPEVDLPLGQDPYSMAVYEQGKTRFWDLVSQGLFQQEDKPCYYLYRLVWQGHAQHGLVAAAAVADYEQGIIKRHELTRPDKEEDRRQHIRVSNIHAEPVFFAYPGLEELHELAHRVVQHSPLYDFMAEDEVQHTLWKISGEQVTAQITQLFAEKVQHTYVADGHHRTAAAAGVGGERKAANASHQGTEGYNYFLAVHFPAEELRILDYNRLISSLNGWENAAFLREIEKSFDCTALPGPYHPEAPHYLGLYLQGQWYRLAAQSHTYDPHDPHSSLDVTILTEHILRPLLGIVDQRRDERISFVGGIRGLEALEAPVDAGEMACAFALYPVSMQEVMDIADAGAIMPPKVTWFEPKLRSGLFVYSLEDAMT